MKDYRLTKGSLRNLLNLMLDMLKVDEVLTVTVEKFKEPIRPTQRKLWRVWMSETSKVMAERGVKSPVVNSNGKTLFSRPISPDDCHEMFMSLWGGLDNNGERESSSDKNGKKGEMQLIMDKHLAFCAERGIVLSVPKDSEYSELDSIQNS